MLLNSHQLRDTTEGINRSYVSRVLRLTLLAPDVVERVVKGERTTSLDLSRLMKPFPTDWEQRERFR